MNAVDIALRLIDQGYNRKAWHGPNLRGSIRRVDARTAAWRPDPKRRCIYEIVVHTAYWKYAVRRRLLGEKRGSFEFKGSNWFPMPPNYSESDWHSAVRLLDQNHRLLKEAVASFDPRDLFKRFPGSKYFPIDQIQGIAAHDIYHAGQIQLLKRLILNAYA